MVSNARFKSREAEVTPLPLAQKGFLGTPVRNGLAVAVTLPEAGSVTGHLLDVLTGLNMIQLDPSITNGRLYKDSSISLFKKIGSSIRSLDPDSGDFRIVCGYGDVHRSLHYYLSAKVVNHPGDYSWTEVKTLFTYAAGLTVPLEEPVEDDFDFSSPGFSFNFGPSIGRTDEGIVTVDDVPVTAPIPVLPLDEEDPDPDAGQAVDFDPRGPQPALLDETTFYQEFGLTKPNRRTTCADPKVNHHFEDILHHVENYMESLGFPVWGANSLYLAHSLLSDLWYIRASPDSDSILEWIDPGDSPGVSDVFFITKTLRTFSFQRERSRFLPGPDYLE
jgi:hypothetical protein